MTMTLSDLAAPGSFISGIGVIVSLVYLALQVKQAKLHQQGAICEKHDHFRFLHCDAGGCTAELEGQSIGFDAGPGGIVLTRLSAVWVA
jgi:hypothetical protein